LKSKIGALYGVAVDKFKMKFDGDVLKDGSTPNNYDMEDGDLIDISVSTQLGAMEMNTKSNFALLRRWKRRWK
jgi:hypothetical protein